jgi:uncharacterized protein YjbI with pentapeptide repeats
MSGLPSWSRCRIGVIAACLGLAVASSYGCEKAETETERRLRLNAENNEARDRAFSEARERDFAKLKQTGSCEDCIITGKSWPGAQLRGANLRGAGFGPGDYRGADLRDADLRQAGLART